ncbi:MAG: hypothetical protein COB26_10935 [Piscirickettsiaceae bacterium]|nr:MAG: hypothetical protein COB26_10935 [Piscirickettsiaceae bacterium]
MRKINNLIWMCLIALCLVHSFSFAATFNKNANKALEVRILVDVSGNMKESDARGFRQSSLKLFAKLMPTGAKAGIWIFDDRVTEILPVSKVGESWRAKALRSIEKIHANGEVSHLEKALAVASLDWVAPDNKTKRHIIVLTDGKITLGSGKRADLASKNRVKSFQKNRLKSLGVHVHVIALSEDADKDMLESLSTDTEGWYDQVKTLSHLERTLLRVSKRLVQKNSIPIIANKFVIDDAVREFTAVVFRKKGFGSTQLDDPEGMDFGRDSKRHGVEWHREKRYDIVTVTNPMEGEWRLVAPSSPDNEIFITTKLQMAVDELPDMIIAGADSRIKMLMAEKGKLVTNSNFLNVITATVELKDKRGNVTKIEMEQDMITGGYFFADIGKDLKIGPYEMVVRAKANTFERVETMAIYVKPKPKVKAKVVDITPEFRKVLNEAGIEVPEEKAEEEMPLVCPEPVVKGDGVKSEEATEEADDGMETEEEDEEGSWMITSAIVLLVNLLLAVAGFFGFKMHKEKSAMADEALINKLST